MTQKFKQIQISSLDKRFNKLSFEAKPKLGWIKIIRADLSMPLAFPASKLKVSQQAIAKLEKGEIEEVVGLKSSRKLVEAMNCEPHYANFQKI